jgi:hypothetical protein
MRGNMLFNTAGTGQSDSFCQIFDDTTMISQPADWLGIPQPERAVNGKTREPQVNKMSITKARLCGWRNVREL